MPSEEPRPEDTRAWLLKAAKDLRLGEIDLSVEPPEIEDAMFHCQQAVEKALKAFLTWHDSPFKKTHNLKVLLEQCTVIDGSLVAWQPLAAELTKYVWLFRYPGEGCDLSPDEARRALAAARDIAGAILSRLPAEARVEIP